MTQEPACGEAAALTKTTVVWPGGRLLLGDVLRQTLRSNDWTVNLHEIYPDLAAMIQDSVHRVYRVAKAPILTVQTTTKIDNCACMRVCGPESDARNSWHAVVCARAAIVKSWAHGCIPVPKGAKLSNNALFELRGMQATTSQSCGMRISWKAVILCGQSGVFLIT